ncbi:class I SAM-dependent methyltransferase [Actinophytocola sp. NPDC049390]|uniref:class I SAM-dependent methyltransferase n=1 Tax=Actinophytocola sp. NPDC049390 TaxID=3363894 RepID=UPI00379B9010
MSDLGDVFDAGQDEFAVLGPVLWNPIGAATVAEAGLRPGDRVLDVCCGAGASAIPAARAVGAGGHVDAIDLAERLLEQGRANARDLPQLTFTHADATGWATTGYDVVQCVFGVFFLPEMDTAAARLASLVKPGGRFVVTTWDEHAISPVPEILGDAVVAAGGDPKPRLGRGPAERISTPGKLRDWLTGLGLDDVRVVTFEHSMPLDDTTSWAIVMGSAMRIRLNGLPESLLPQVRTRFLDLLRDRKVDRMNAVSLIGMGRMAE